MPKVDKKLQAAAESLAARGSVLKTSIVVFNKNAFNQLNYSLTILVILRTNSCINNIIQQQVHSNWLTVCLSKPPSLKNSIMYDLVMNFKQLQVSPPKQTLGSSGRYRTDSAWNMYWKWFEYRLWIHVLESQVCSAKCLLPGDWAWCSQFTTTYYWMRW